MQPKKLTPKQERFCQEYLIDLNATQAAIRAGYSAANAETIGYQLLQKTPVREFIDRLKDERSEETKIDAAWVLKRLAEEAVADIADIYDDDGRLLPIKKWPLIWRQGLVAGVETETTRRGGDRGSGQWRGPAQDVHEPDPDDEEATIVTKIRLSERIRRIELIGKHVSVKAFEEQVAVTGLDALAERLERAARGEK